MEIRNGIYRLVKKNDEGKEIFDFNETLEFFFFFFKVKKNALSTIDSLTTLFKTGEQLDRCTSKKDSIQKSSYEIEYTYNKKDKILPVVWNDYFLNDITNDIRGKNGGCVNINNINVRQIISDVYYKIEHDLSFYEAYLKSRASKCINDHNKELICEIHDTGWKSNNDSAYYFERFKRNFTNYKEFREIYLLLKEYREFLIKGKEKEKEKVYKLDRNIKKNNGQISMFD